METRMIEELQARAGSAVCMRRSALRLIKAVAALGLAFALAPLAPALTAEPTWTPSKPI